MSLAPGQSLLHFRLVEKIGEGGMGEVWKALDTSLGREVAVKVLPAAFAADADRRARFEREAKLLGSLSHPNIATIHGLFEAGGVHFLAMELVRGEDLAAVLERGAMPLGEALDAAKQVASALEAAHEAQVIHRDLKPANVKRTPDGTVKVLDFGLAKALESAEPTASRIATVTSAGSVAGMILGTASYMSPEQARGQPVDRRTDLWAFGCLLYEMLTGSKAFDGPTVTDVLAAVVTGEPDWSKLPSSTPVSVRRLLRRCLEKDLRKRQRDAGDAGLALDEDRDGSSVRSITPVPARRSMLALFALLALIAAIAGPAAGWWIAQRGPASSPGGSIGFTRLTFSRGMMRAARFAPDGQTIVYGAAWGAPPTKLYLGRTEEAEATPIALPPAELLAISKKGELAVAVGLNYYGWMGEGTLARTSLLGGAPREIAENIRVADWSPDGTELAVVRRTEGQDQLEYPLGKVLDTTRAGYFGDVRVSPDGEHVAYTDHPSWGDNQGSVAVVDRSGHKTKLDTDVVAVQGLAWSPDGKEIWYSAQEDQYDLYAIDLRGQRRVVYTSLDYIELFDIAPDGRVLVGAQRQEREVLVKLEGDTEPRSVHFSGQASLSRGIDPNGRAVLVSDHLPKEYETYVVRSGQPGAVRLTTGDGMGVSPDGRFALTSSFDYRKMSITPLGIGASRSVPNPDGIDFTSIPSWHPDGKHFIATGSKRNEPSRAFVLDVENGSATAFGPPGANWNVFTGPPVSPDGRFAVLRDSAGACAQWPLAGGNGRAIPGLLPADQPLIYFDDGRSLLVSGRSLPVVIERLDLATGKRSPWMTLAPTDSAGLRYALVSITPNGKYWSLSVAKLLTDLYVVKGLE